MVVQSHRIVSNGPVSSETYFSKSNSTNGQNKISEYALRHLNAGALILCVPAQKLTYAVLCADCSIHTLSNTIAHKRNTFQCDMSSSAPWSAVFHSMHLLHRCWQVLIIKLCRQFTRDPAGFCFVFKVIVSSLNDAVLCCIWYAWKHCI